MSQIKTGASEFVELTFRARQDYANPYTDAEVSVEFRGPSGEEIRRPAFWDGDGLWRVRFTAPGPEREWSWRSVCSDPLDVGLHDQQGSVVVPGTHPHSLLRMSPERRSVVNSDGSPFFLVGDTAWALPWRGTPETVAEYAQNRHCKGFNAALLMSVQPDCKAVGPRDRNAPGGFDVGFEDLTSGHLNCLNPAYFQRFDTLVTILLAHSIVPIYQPVFQGYGWKGLEALGSQAIPVEYARFCRYLVARYGAWPALWLVSADGDGLAPCVAAGGEEIFVWDAYHQPLGIHYNPFDDNHQNRSHQAAEWLDFQWCQTGHEGLHQDKVSAMCGNLPTKGVANGEPTYEGIGDPARAAGWWQGDEAWRNLTAGGTMGIFYGVAALWQWKLAAHEPGWPAWAVDRYSWRDALTLEGSDYVGLISLALTGYETTDMARHPERAGGGLCVARPGEVYCVYLPGGGDVTLSGITRPLPACWFNPRSGATQNAGRVVSGERLYAPDDQPWALLVGARHQKSSETLDKPCAAVSY